LRLRPQAVQGSVVMAGGLAGMSVPQGVAVATLIALAL